MTTRSRWLRPLVALLMAGLSGCGLSGCAPSEPTIGVALPLSGDLAAWGQEAWSGIELARRQSWSGPALIVQDTHGTPSGTNDAYENLVEQGAVLVLGPLATDNALAAGPVARRCQVPFLSPSATGVAVTGVDSFAQRICYTDDEAAAALAAFATKDLGLTRVALVVDLSTSYSVGLSDAFSREFAVRHGRVIAELAFWRDDEAVSGILDRAVAFDIEAVMMTGYGGDLARMLDGSSDPRVADLILLGGDGWDSSAVRAAAVNRVRGAYHTSHFSAADPRPDVAPFTQAYRELHQTDPSGFAALAFDAATAAFAVFDPGLDGVALRNRLRTLPEFEGATGRIDMDATGSPRDKGIVVEAIHESGQPRFVQRAGGR